MFMVICYTARLSYLSALNFPTFPRCFIFYGGVKVLSKVCKGLICNSSIVFAVYIKLSIVYTHNAIVGYGDIG